MWYYRIIKGGLSHRLGRHLIQTSFFLPFFQDSRFKGKIHPEWLMWTAMAFEIYSGSSLNFFHRYGGLFRFASRFASNITQNTIRLHVDSGTSRIHPLLHFYLKRAMQRRLNTSARPSHTSSSAQAYQHPKLLATFMLFMLISPSGWIYCLCCTLVWLLYSCTSFWNVCTNVFTISMLELSRTHEWDKKKFLLGCF